MNITIIGFGNMAKAIARGLMHNKSNRLFVAAPSLPIGINADGIHTHSNNLAIIPNADVIILAVKPAQMSTVLEDISPVFSANCLIISVASGLNLSWFSHHIPHNCSIVRAMPNLAAATKQSATPLIANQFVSDQQKNIATQLFDSIGITTWVTDESQIDAFTALSGSGPAYVFLFMEAMISAAVTLGISLDIATSFTLQTVSGAVNMANKDSCDLAQLRAAVTSKAGTTAAALQVLTSGGFNDLIQNAMHAAYVRAQELGHIN